MNKNMFPPSITNLLLSEGQRFKVDGDFKVALERELYHYVRHQEAERPR